MKIYDCFTFYNEFELLELRLKSLYDVVDYFVIVEADKTQSNIPKPFYFDEHKNDFAEFLPKIKNVKVNMNVPYKGTGDWSIENAQRNAIFQGLTDAEPDDFIFISDLDEIWAPNILQQILNNTAKLIKNHRLPLFRQFRGKKIFIPFKVSENTIDFLEHSPIALEQTFHYYYFDWIAQDTWHGTVLTKFKNLTTPQELRNLRMKMPFLREGGWHFSYMGGAARVIDKMKAIVEGDEFVKANANLLDKNHVEKSMTNGTDIYGRKNVAESQFLPYDVSNIKLPYLAEFVKKYPQFVKAEGSF